MTLWLIRHGQTKGNREHRYVGVTDEGILPEEKERLCAMGRAMTFRPSLVFVSPARRCLETARCLFPYACGREADVPQGQLPEQGSFVHASRANEKKAQLILVPEFMEMNFGAFEYKTYQEINADSDPAHRLAYQRYIDTNGESAFPGGESKAEFARRVCAGFEEKVIPVLWEREQRAEEEIQAACIVHGGTIMALMERYGNPKKPYFEWGMRPGEGYEVQLALAEGMSETDHENRKWYTIDTGAFLCVNRKISMD